MNHCCMVINIMPCVDYLSADFPFDKLLACKYFLEEIPVQLLLFTNQSMAKTIEFILPVSGLQLYI